MWEMAMCQLRFQFAKKLLMASVEIGKSKKRIVECKIDQKSYLLMDFMVLW